MNKIIVLQWIGTCYVFLTRRSAPRLRRCRDCDNFFQPMDCNYWQNICLKSESLMTIILKKIKLYKLSLDNCYIVKIFKKMHKTHICIYFLFWIGWTKTYCVCQSITILQYTTIGWENAGFETRMQRNQSLPF